MKDSVSPFTWAAVTQYYGPRNLKTTEISFSQFWRLGSPCSRHQQTQCLLRACFLACRQTAFLLQPHIANGVRGLFGALWGLFCKSSNPTHEISTLMTWSPSKGPHLLKPSHWGLGNILISGGTQQPVYGMPEPDGHWGDVWTKSKGRPRSSDAVWFDPQLNPPLEADLGGQKAKKP